MLLHVGDTTHTLQCFDSVEFSGDLEARATLVQGPVRDLNLMVRRAAGLGRPVLTALHVAEGENISMQGALALVVLAGTLSMAQSQAEPLDVILSETSDTSASAQASTITAVTNAVIALARLHR